MRAFSAVLYLVVFCGISFANPGRPTVPSKEKSKSSNLANYQNMNG